MGIILGWLDLWTGVYAILCLARADGVAMTRYRGIYRYRVPIAAIREFRRWRRYVTNQ